MEFTSQPAIMRKNILILGHNDTTQFIDIYNQYTLLFDKDHYEVTVAFLAGNPDEATRQRLLAERVIFFQLAKKKLRSLKIFALQKLFVLCKEKKFHIVICHRYKPTYLMMIVAQFIKIPALIFVMHELKTMISHRRQILIRFLIRKNMLLAGVSNAVRDDIQKHLWHVSKNQIITLYNTIDVQATESQLFSRHEARKLLALNEDDFVFGNVARLVSNKDQKSLIAAFAILLSSCPTAKLIILGEGELKTQLLEQVKKAGLINSVIFTGFLASGFRYMKAFDCFVLSSTQEAFGRVLLEAMIAKIPIIATAVNGIPEVLANTNLLVLPKDPSSFAAAMQKIYLLSTQEREKIAEIAYQHVKSNFSIPKFREDFWQLPLLQELKR